MRFLKNLRGISLAGVLLMAFVVSAAPATFADTLYGRGTYGNCTYGTCATHTVTQTPSGLKVAVNLTDGQIIPASGYTITITPLNGSGTSFSSADILIDGTKVATIAPGQDGTAQWRWDPGVNPGTHVQLLITDSSGAVTTMNFSVTIGPATNPMATSSQGNGGAPTAAPDNRLFAQKLLSDATQKAKQAIKKLPAPVVYTFPYLLFALLLLEIVVLLLQTKRELHELETAKQLAAQEHEIAGMKQTLIELVSHYLRTPLTILQGGAEGLSRDGVPPAMVTALQGVVKQVHDIIESLIASTAQASTVTTEEVAPTAAAPRRFALSAGRVAIWLPVVLVGALVFGFVYLANEVSRFTTNTIGMLTQLVVYSILILTLYQVVRRWHLHRRDSAAAKKILAEQAAVQTLRDNLITQTAGQLQAQVASLGSLASGLPATAANAKFINRGYAQLNTVTNKFVIASHLKGARSSDAYQATSVAALFDQLDPALKQAASDKQVTIAQPAAATPLAVQNPGLLLLVLQTILDNAVSYSPQGGSVELESATEAGESRLSVTDHGSGISADKQAALFQPFFKIEGAEEFNREGMGFSLYLDKLIMTYLGGTIALDSQPGQQTRVAVSWPTK